MQNFGQKKFHGNDQYPKTIAETNNELSNHRFNVVTNKKNSKGNHREATKEKDSDESPKLTFAQMEGECFLWKEGNKPLQSRNMNRSKE